MRIANIDNRSALIIGDAGSARGAPITAAPSTGTPRSRPQSRLAPHLCGRTWFLLHPGDEPVTRID